MKEGVIGKFVKNKLGYLSVVGVRRETIGNVENGRYNPSLKLAMDIAKTFGCRVEDLFEDVNAQNVVE